MAEGFNKGKDAASIAPKFVPDDERMPRDDSGGPDYKPRSADFGDGGKVKYPKPALSA